jgi:hypothetical protein
MCDVVSRFLRNFGVPQLHSTHPKKTYFFLFYLTSHLVNWWSAPKIWIQSLFRGHVLGTFLYFRTSCQLSWIFISLANDQLEAQILKLFITILYMFRAISCSSSGGQILLIQHLVSSLLVSERPVHLCFGRSLTKSDDTRCCINTIWPPEDEQDIARNMYM